MKIKLSSIVIFILAVFLAWFFGYIKFPYVPSTKIFWLGLLAGVSVILLVFLVFYFLGKINLHWITSSAAPYGKGPMDRSPFPNRILMFILAILVVIAGYTAYSINNSKIKCVQGLNAELKALKHQAGIEELGHKSEFFLQLLEALDSLKFNNKDTPEYKRRLDLIISLSSGFKVHKQWDPEYQTYRELSWTRGMLLLALLNANLDSSSFQKMKDQISFSFADLRNADLSGRNLQGIDLSNANLEQANLEATQLDYANLKRANLTGANLNKASLIESNLIGARLNWARANEVNMFYARLDSSDFSNASMSRSYLKYATSIHTLMRYALLNESDLSNGFFIGTDFSYANLSKANLKDPDFRKAIFNETILDESIVDENWMDNLNKENNEGIQNIYDKYKMVYDSVTIKDSVIIRLALK